MEEIDSIIINSLRNLNCDLEEDVTSLKQFDAETIVNAISLCLEAIRPDTTFPKKLPPSMSIKLKIASSLAAQIKDLGFRDDIGYQTILYCNEVEIRRVLMFLIEKLPRETKIIQVEETGYIPTLIKEIGIKVKNSMEQFWVPSCVLNNGYRTSDNGIIFNSLGNCRGLHTKKLKVPCSRKNHEVLKQYWNHNVPVVTKQCTSKELLPSLLFQDCLFDNNFDLTKSVKYGAIQDTESTQLILNPAKIIEETDTTEAVESEIDSHLKSATTQLEEKKEECLKLEKDIKVWESKIEQATKAKIEREENLQKSLSQLDLKSKTATVLSKEENIQKLKNMIESSKNKLISLTEQWNKIQTPLLEEYKSLQNTITNKDLKKRQEKEKLKKLEETHQTLTKDLQEKTQLEEQLRKKLDQVNKGHTRSGYTRRILEIIGNIKKQDEEIQKILKDTKEVQREISILTGQVDRSFTLADELIFRDAKHDETARKSYKLLVQLHDDCSSIIKAITELGAVERECRNLQEQIDSETAKEIAVKLERVNKDLDEIRKETEMLLKQKT